MHERERAKNLALHYPNVPHHIHNGHPTKSTHTLNLPTTAPHINLSAPTPKAVLTILSPSGHKDDNKKQHRAPYPPVRTERQTPARQQPLFRRHNTISTPPLRQSAPAPTVQHRRRAWNRHSSTLHRRSHAVWKHRNPKTSKKPRSRRPRPNRPEPCTSPPKHTTHERRPIPIRQPPPLWRHPDRTLQRTNHRRTPAVYHARQPPSVPALPNSTGTQTSTSPCTRLVANAPTPPPHSRHHLNPKRRITAAISS